MRLFLKVITAAALTIIFQTFFGEGFYSGYGCAWAQVISFTIIEILIDKSDS